MNEGRGRDIGNLASSLIKADRDILAARMEAAVLGEPNDVVEDGLALLGGLIQGQLQAPAEDLASDIEQISLVLPVLQLALGPLAFAPHLGIEEVQLRLLRRRGAALAGAGPPRVCLQQRVSCFPGGNVLGDGHGRVGVSQDGPDVQVRDPVVGGELEPAVGQHGVGHDHAGLALADDAPEPEAVGVVVVIDVGTVLEPGQGAGGVCDVVGVKVGGAIHALILDHRDVGEVVGEVEVVVYDYNDLDDAGF